MVVFWPKNLSLDLADEDNIRCRINGLGPIA